jgi:DNA-binding response OmpR family regulator
MRVLAVEDDPDVGDHLVIALGEAGFIVDLVSDGDDAWFRGDTEDYAAVILDLGLPKLDGLSVLRRWRSAGRTFPVLILSARGDWNEKVEGIDAGADDYMAKPFVMGELVSRLRGLLRRVAGHVTATITVGRLSLDTSRMTAAVDGRSIRLSPLEYRFLDLLSHQPGRVASPQHIADHLYGAADAGDTNAIEALVTRLRRKIGPDVVETRRGLGYALVEDAA